MSTEFSSLNQPLTTPLAPVSTDYQDQKPLATEEERKRKYRAELINRQKDSGQKLSDFLLALRDELRSVDSDAREKYLQDVDMMCRYVNGDQYGQYVNGVYQAPVFNDGDFAYTIPVITGHTEQAFMQMLKTKVEYEFAAKNEGNPNDKLVAAMCEELAVEEKDRLMDDEARMDEIMNSILAGVSYRCLVWGVNPDAPKTVTRMSYTDETTQMEGHRECQDCGYEVEEGQESCPHCGSTDIKDMEGPTITRQQATTTEVALGENLLHIPNLLGVQRDLQASKLKHATFIVERDFLPLADAEWRYQTFIEPDTGALPVDLRYQYDQQRASMQTDPIVGSARQWGSHSYQRRPVSREYIYLDPSRYGAFYNPTEETTPDGDKCAVGLLGDTYPDGVFLLTCGNTIIKLKACNFRRRWTEVFFGKRAGSSRGAGLQCIMPLNDIVNDSFNLDYSLGMAGHPFTAVVRKHVKDLPEINNLLFLDNVPPGGIDAVVRRFPGQAPTGFLGATSQQIQAAMQFIAGTMTVTGQYGAPDNQVMSTATGVAAAQENASGRMVGPIHQMIQADKEFMFQILDNLQEYCSEEKSPEQFRGLVKRFGPDVCTHFFKCNFRQTVNINVAANTDAPRSMALTQAKAMAFGQIAQAFARTEVPWAEDMLASLADTLGIPFDIGPGRTDRREATYRLNKLAAIEEEIKAKNSMFLANTQKAAVVMMAALAEFCDPLMQPADPTAMYLQDHDAFMDVYKDALFSEDAKTWSDARRHVVVEMWMLHFQAKQAGQFKEAEKQRALAETVAPPPPQPTPEELAAQQDQEDERMVNQEILRRHADEQAKDADSQRRMTEAEHQAELDMAKADAERAATPPPPPPTQKAKPASK